MPDLYEGSTLHDEFDTKYCNSGPILQLFFPNISFSLNQKFPSGHVFYTFRNVQIFYYLFFLMLLHI
jgi:hypothetical protein